MSVRLLPPLLAIALILGLCTLTAGSLATSAGCGSAAQEVKAGAVAVWDCTSPELAPAVATLVPVGLQLLTDLLASQPGPVDLAPFYAFLDGAKDRVGACVLAKVFKNRMTVPVHVQAIVGTPGPRPDPVLRATFERIRAERFGGATLLTPDGPL